jgi:hypothetical protein
LATLLPVGFPFLDLPSDFKWLFRFCTFPAAFFFSKLIEKYLFIFFDNLQILEGRFHFVYHVLDSSLLVLKISELDKLKEK